MSLRVDGADRIGESSVPDLTHQTDLILDVHYSCRLYENKRWKERNNRVLFINNSNNRLEEISMAKRRYKPPRGSKSERYEYKMRKMKKHSSGCYIATSVYGSYDCPEVWTLRRFRDNTLSKSWFGRAVIRIYYAVSPSIVKWFGSKSWFKNIWRAKLDRIVQLLKKQGVEDTPYEDGQ